MANPFLSQQGGLSVPNPLYNQSGQYNPAITKATNQYSQSAMNAVGQHLSRRGLDNSSMMGVGLQSAYRTGFDRAIGEYLQQQQLYGGLAQQQMAMQMQQGQEPKGPSFLQGALGGAAMGAGLGMFGGPAGAGIGAGIGAGVGILDNVLNLGLFG